MALTRSGSGSFQIAVRNLQRESKRESFDRFKLLCEKIIADTPVFSGELRANYDIRYGLSPSGQAYVHGRTTQGGVTLPPKTFDLAFDPEKQEPLVIGSAVPYVLMIEYSSWSAQAPHGMINRAIDEVYGDL